MERMQVAKRWLEGFGARRLLLVAGLLLAVACILLYLPSFAFPWIYDDVPLVVDNPDIRSLGNFLANQVPGRPLRELTLLLDYRLFGLNAAGYHLQNLFWHLASGTLLLVVVRKVWRSDWTAFVAAAFFLFHPLCVEVLAQASHRKDSLCLCFSLAALACWIDHYGAGRRRWWLLVGSGVLLAIALSAKQNALALLPLLLLYDQLVPPPQERVFRGDRRTLLLILGGALLVGGVAVAVVLRNGVGSVIFLPGYYLQVIKANVFMLSKAVWPFGLSPEYTLLPPRMFFDPWVLSGVVLLVAWLLLQRTVRDPGFRFWLWAVPLLLLPTANLFGQVAYAAADRYMYAPLAALAALAAWGLTRLPGRNLLLVLLLGLLGWGTFVQEQVWSSPLNFYQRITSANPLVGVSAKSNVALLNLAEELRKTGQDRDAIARYRQCFEQTPLKHEAMIGLADLFERRGQLGAAVAALEQAEAVAGERAETLAYLIALAIKAGDPARGEQLGRRYLAHFPPQAEVLSNLGVANEQLGELTRAADYQRRALTLESNYTLARFNLAQVLIKQGERDLAIVELRRILNQAPDDVRSLSGLGELLVATGRSAEVPPLLTRLQTLDVGRARRLWALLAAAGNGSVQRD